MLGTLLGIVAYGVWKTRNIASVQSYLLGDRDLPWWTIGTVGHNAQSSAITFVDARVGLRRRHALRPVLFQYAGGDGHSLHFCIALYYRLQSIHRLRVPGGAVRPENPDADRPVLPHPAGAGGGADHLRPAIILSTILGWSLNWTIFFIGLVVIFYTVMGAPRR